MFEAPGLGEFGKFSGTELRGIVGLQGLRWSESREDHPELENDFRHSL